MKKINRNKYFLELNKYSQRISFLIEDEFKKIDIEEHKNFFLKKRKKRSYHRPFLFKCCMEILSDKKINIELLATYIEILNISTYLSNHSFDEKNSVNSKLKSNNQVIASIILRDYLDLKLIEFSKSIGIEKSLKLINIFSSINYNIYLGQYLDINQLTIDKYKSFKNEEDYLKEYEKRCYLITGLFEEKIVQIATVFSNKKLEEEILLNFAKYLGIGIQVVNDIGDFLLETTGSIDTHKDHQDYFADLRNDKLTLPIYYALHSSKLEKKILKIAKEDTYGLVLYQEIAKIMYEEGIFKKSKMIALKYYKLANNELKKLPDSKEKAYLKNMLLLLKVNKYYTTLRMKYDTNY